MRDAALTLFVDFFYTPDPLFHVMPSNHSQRKKNFSLPFVRSTNSQGPRALFEDPPLTVYLIRHGESVAQTFSNSKRARELSLRDCALTEKGEFQSIVLPSVLGLDRYRQIDCVVCSPLTRAVKTSVLAFPSKPIIINYDLMEIGRDKNPMPENRARPIMDVMSDTGGESLIDEGYFAPKNKSFPQSHQNSPASVRKSKLPKVWEAIWECCNRRKCQRVAVVCHFNVIRMSVINCDVRPKNAIPIECRLYRDGRLELADVLSDQVQEMTESLADLKRRSKWCMRGAPEVEETDENEITENSSEDSPTLGEEEISSLDSL